MRKCLLSIIGIIPMLLYANGNNVGGICYIFAGDSASVTYLGTRYDEPPHYTGDITIPESVNYGTKTYRVTSIGDYAFTYCSGLTSISIPETITKFGGGAFGGCTGLKTIIIPSTVKSLGVDALYGCQGLLSMTCLAIVPPSCANPCFNYISSFYMPVYVPDGSVQAYKNAYGWSVFYNILPISATSISAPNWSKKSTCPQKYIENGYVYILHEGRKFLISGNESK